MYSLPSFGISFSPSMSSSEEATLITWYIQIVYIIGIIVLAFVGNILIFSVICSIKRLHTIDNMFIANLAVSDFLFTLIETSSNTTRELNTSWRPPQEFACYVIMAASVLCASASVLTQVAVAINRYIAITRPLQYPNLVNKKRVFISIIAIWIGAIILALPPLIWRPLVVICGHEESYAKHIIYEIIYMTAEWLFIFGIPFGIMSVIYHRVYRIARTQANRVRPGASDESASTSGSDRNDRKNNISHFKREFKAAKMLVTIAGAFLFSWCPFFLTLTLWKFHVGIQNHPKVFTTCLYIVYTLPAINPAIYAFWLRDIRSGIKQLLTCWKRNS